MNLAIRSLAVSAILLHLLGGCADGGLAPVVSRAPEPQSTGVSTRSPHPAGAPRPTAGVRPPVHVVERGDTLYSIAWRYGLDYRAIAGWNALASPDRIMVGQRLLLRPPESVSPVPRPATAALPGATSQPALPPPIPASGVKPALADAAPAPAAAPSPPPGSVAPSASAPQRLAGATRWQWPARGKVRQTSGTSGRYGIVINGAAGQPVNAAAAGQVVYSGSGLIGYGKLIIIKHDDTFLSAYAHNDKLLVNEGAYVAAGQQIAEMGSSGAREVMLRFEIRRNGKPVPPLDYLPKS